MRRKEKNLYGFMPMRLAGVGNVFWKLRPFWLYEAPLPQLVRLKNKVVRIINNVPLRDHITPHYVNLGVIKLPDIVKLYMCQLFYDHLIDKKSSNLNLSLVSKKHNYATRSASLQYLNPESFRINM